MSELAEFIPLGTFIFLNALAFGSMGYALNQRLPLANFLHILAMVLFIVLALFMVSDYDVAQVQTDSWTDGTTTWTANQTNVFINADIGGYVMWIYMGFFTLSMLLFFSRRGLLVKA